MLRRALACSRLTGWGHYFNNLDPLKDDLACVYLIWLFVAAPCGYCYVVAFLFHINRFSLFFIISCTMKPLAIPKYSCKEKSRNGFGVLKELIGKRVLSLWVE